MYIDDTLVVAIYLLLLYVDLFYGVDEQSMSQSMSLLILKQIVCSCKSLK